MNKAFPHFGGSQSRGPAGNFGPGRGPFPAEQVNTLPALTRCQSLNMVFVPLLARERDLQSSITSLVLSRRRCKGARLASLLRSQHAQLGSIVFILSQQYELHPSPTHTLGAPPRLPAASNSRKQIGLLKGEMIRKLAEKHEVIIQSIEGLAREFSGNLRGAMILGHIAQRHRQMLVALEAMLGGQTVIPD